MLNVINLNRMIKLEDGSEWKAVLSRFDITSVFLDIRKKGQEILDVTHRYSNRQNFHTALHIKIEENLPKDMLSLCPVCQREIPEKIKSTIKAILLNMKLQ